VKTAIFQGALYVVLHGQAAPLTTEVERKTANGVSTSHSSTGRQERCGQFRGHGFLPSQRKQIWRAEPERGFLYGSDGETYRSLLYGEPFEARRRP